MHRGLHLKHKAGTGGVLATGVVSGLLNGSAAVGGPPAVLFFFSSPVGVDVSRASLIAFFLGTDIIAVGTCAGMGLLSGAAVRLFLILLLPMGIGLLAGNRSFLKVDPSVFRKKVMLYLFLLSGFLLAGTLLDFY
jgi:uncharacterized membrane protein YfcA